MAPGFAWIGGVLRSRKAPSWRWPCGEARIVRVPWGLTPRSPEESGTILQHCWGRAMSLFPFPELVDSKRDQDQGERLKLCRPCHMLRDPWNQIEQGKHLSEASTQGPGDLPGPSHEDISGRDGRDGCKDRIVSYHVDVQNERPREDRGPE